MEVYICPEAPGSRLDSRSKIVWLRGSSGPDGYSARDMTAVPSTSEPDGTPSGRHFEGAWFGRRRHYNDLDAPVEVFDGGYHSSLRRGGRLKFITDGLTKTVLICEMAGMPESYGPGVRRNTHGHYDNAGWAVGNISVLNGLSSKPPNYRNRNHAFSFHPGGVNTAMCDGSVRWINEDIDRTAFRGLLARGRRVVRS